MLTLINPAGPLPRHYRGISSDVTTNGECYNVERNNGDEIYTMDTQGIYFYDGENEKWLDVNGSEV